MASPLDAKETPMHPHAPLRTRPEQVRRSSSHPVGHTHQPSLGRTAPRSLLVVTTVSDTMGFLYPFVRHFRAQGWRVDGCARGVTTDPKAIEAFDDVHDLPLSRSVKDVAGMAQTVRALRDVVGHDYDIVHVHTPIAAFLARAVIRRMPPSQRPNVVYTAHGFHFHKGGHPVTNQAFILAERVAGRWTDRLVVMNADDFEAANRYNIVPRRRLKYMRGIGVDTQWYAPGSLEPDAVQRALGSIGMDPTGSYFVTVGELSRRKRPEDVVRALAGMQDRKTRLLLLGDSPDPVVRGEGRGRGRRRRARLHPGQGQRHQALRGWCCGTGPSEHP